MRKENLQTNKQTQNCALGPQCRNEIKLPLKFHVSNPLRSAPISFLKFSTVGNRNTSWKHPRSASIPKMTQHPAQGVSRAHIWGLCHCPGQTAYGDAQLRTGSRGASCPTCCILPL